MTPSEQREHLLRNAESAIIGTVNDMLNEGMPGIEGRSREELGAIVRRIHQDTIDLFLRGEIAALDAPLYEWKRIAEELKVIEAKA